VDRFSLAAMFALAALCLAAGILPGFVIDGLAPVTQSLVADRMPLQSEIPWLSIVPIAESRSSYNGLLVFAFIAISASLAVLVIHRWGSHAVRRAPAWDCGWPDPSPATQYTAASFAQPIRRVFATQMFRASEDVDMPPPGEPTAGTAACPDSRPRLGLPLQAGCRRVGFAAERLNYLQFLTIRRYLSLVFLALVTLLTVVAVWT
jgi:hydrogenase-4 component B